MPSMATSVAPQSGAIGGPFLGLAMARGHVHQASACRVDRASASGRVHRASACSVGLARAWSSASSQSLPCWSRQRPGSNQCLLCRSRKCYVEPATIVHFHTTPSQCSLCSASHQNINSRCFSTAPKCDRGPGLTVLAGI